MTYRADPISCRLRWLAIWCMVLGGIFSVALFGAVSNNETSYWRGRTLLELREGADKGNAIAQRLLGHLYLTGDSLPTNAVEAAKWFRLSADQGDALAQLALGMMAAEGEGVPRSKEEAAKWYRRAAELGVTEAQVNLASCYTRGAGVPQDDTEATRWYRKAAEAGDRLGQANLGFALLEGKGVPKNPAEAVRWLRPAAYQGSTEAAFRLGIMYMQGEGVAKEPDTARVWHTRAAEGGHRDANYEMAYYYLTGPIENRSKGIAFLQRGADLGHARSEHLLGLLMLKGDFVSQDRAAAQVWLSKAVQHGESNAAILLNPTNRAHLDEIVKTDLQTLLGVGTTNTTAPTRDEHPPHAAPPIAVTNSPVLVVTNTQIITNRVTEPVYVNSGSPPAPAYSLKLIVLICFAVSLFSIALVAGLIFTILRKRMTDLERQLSQTREQVIQSNRNLSSILRQVEAHIISGTPLDVNFVIEARENKQLPVTSPQAAAFRSRRERSDPPAKS